MLKALSTGTSFWALTVRRGIVASVSKASPLRSYLLPKVPGSEHLPLEHCPMVPYGVQGARQNYGLLWVNKISQQKLAHNAPVLQFLADVNAEVNHQPKIFINENSYFHSI